MTAAALPYTEVKCRIGRSPDEVAHFVDQRPGSGQDVTAAYIEGTELVAVCGYRWVPTRSADRLPVCGRCVQIVADLERVLWA